MSDKKPGHLRVVTPDGRTVSLDVRPRGRDPGPSLLQAARHLLETAEPCGPTDYIYRLSAALDVLRQAVEREEAK